MEENREEILDVGNYMGLLYRSVLNYKDKTVSVMLATAPGEWVTLNLHQLEGLHAILFEMCESYSKLERIVDY